MKWILLCILSVGLYSCTESMREVDKQMDHVTWEFSKRMWQEEHFYIYCFGGGAPDGCMDHITLRYESKREHPYTLEEARELYVKCVEKLLRYINEEYTAIHPCLCKYPADIENLHFSLAFVNANGKSFQDGSPEYISNCKHRIHYRKKQEGVDGYLDLHEETYEEALRIVQEKASAAQSTDQPQL